jgi:hypothetical protein
MRILLDEDTPVQLIEALRHLLPVHRVDHVSLLNQWSGKSDQAVYADAKRRYQVIITKDRNQLNDPVHARIVSDSRLHRIAFKQRHPGLDGLAIAMGSVIVAIVQVINELERAERQLLVHITGIDPNRRRYEIVDPRTDPPTYWPR